MRPIGECKGEKRKRWKGRWEPLGPRPELAMPPHPCCWRPNCCLLCLLSAAMPATAHASQVGSPRQEREREGERCRGRWEHKGARERERERERERKRGAETWRGMNDAITLRSSASSTVQGPPLECQMPCSRSRGTACKAPPHLGPRAQASLGSHPRALHVLVGLWGSHKNMGLPSQVFRCCIHQSGVCMGVCMGVVRILRSRS